MSTPAVLLTAGILRAQSELDLVTPLLPADGLVALKYALVEDVCARVGEVRAIRRQVREGALTRTVLEKNIHQVLVTLLPTLQTDPWWQPSLARVDLFPRVITLAVDALLSERLSPELRLQLNPIALPALPTHGCIFSAFPHVQNEIYPLLVDAFTARMEGQWRGQAIAVHEKWLANGYCTRALLLDEESFGLVEANLSEPLLLHSAQVLQLNLSEESASHQRIENALPGVKLLNPWAGAALLDDKVITGAIWQRSGVKTPDFAVVVKGMNEEDERRIIEGSLREYGRIVVKPQCGTEGYGVEIIESSLTPSPLSGVGGQPGTGEVWLVMPDCGNTRYAGEQGALRCTLRLNVTWDGARARVESGYAQIAAGSELPASAGRGGRLTTLVDLWMHLCREDGTPITPTPADWRRLLEAAEQGVTALSSDLSYTMPCLLGIDVLLDEYAGQIVPILLEANPRPAGMSHSRFVTEDGPTDEPGVTIRLWLLIDK